MTQGSCERLKVGHMGQNGWEGASDYLIQLHLLSSREYGVGQCKGIKEYGVGQCKGVKEYGVGQCKGIREYGVGQFKG